MKYWKKTGLLPAVALMLFSASSASQAEAKQWPAQTVRLVVPFGPGGPADVVARAIGQKLAVKWGQAVVVDNKPGANTTIGAADVARQPADGYTLLQAINSTLTVNKFTFTKLPYDVEKNFTPIALLANVPVVFVANEKVPGKNLADVLALGKANPGRLTIGGGTVGLQLAAERLSRDAGIQLQYVPYKSGADVTRAVVAGEVDLAVDGLAANLAYVHSGKLRALATNGSARVPALPNMPTLAELGFRNSEAGLWHAILAPAGLPADIRKRIERDLQEVLAMPDIKQRFEALGLEATFANGEALKSQIADESAKLGPLIKSLGLKMD